MKYNNLLLFLKHYRYKLIVSKNKIYYLQFFWKNLHLFGKLSIYFGNSQYFNIINIQIFSKTIILSLIEEK